MRPHLDVNTLAWLMAISLAMPAAAQALPGDNNAGGAAADAVDGDGIRNSASSQDPAHTDVSLTADPSLAPARAKPVRSFALERRIYKAFDGRLRVVGVRINQAEHDKRLSLEQAAKLRQEIAAIRLRYLYADGKQLRRLRAAERHQVDVDIRAQELGAAQFDAP